MKSCLFLHCPSKVEHSNIPLLSLGGTNTHVHTETNTHTNTFLSVKNVLFWLMVPCVSTVFYI